MSQIVTVQTDIKNFSSLEKAWKNLGYSKISESVDKFEIRGKNGAIQVSKAGGSYSFTADSDWLNRGQITALRNEYAKEEALSWAKFSGRTILNIDGNASKGYDIEVSG